MGVSADFICRSQSLDISDSEASDSEATSAENTDCGLRYCSTRAFHFYVNSIAILQLANQRLIAAFMGSQTTYWWLRGVSHGLLTVTYGY